MDDIPSLESQLVSILIYFDFDTVLSYMKMNCQKQYNEDYTKVISYGPWKILTKRGFVIPTIDELKEDVVSLFKSIVSIHNNHPNDDFLCVRTGPFRMTYRSGILDLDCVIESWSCD